MAGPHAPEPPSEAERRAHDAALEGEIRQLEALASGLCQDAGVGVEIAPGPWAWDAARRVFVVSADDLRDHGGDYCAGVLARQVGHAWISRHGAMRVDFAHELAGTLLIDALEAARADAWMAERYPGIEPWLEEVDGTAPPIHPVLPDLLAFILACAGEQRVVHGLRQAAGEAWVATYEARRDYATVLPPATAPAETSAADRARYRLEVLPRLLDARGVPPPFEQQVQLAAARALGLAEAEILPAAEALYAADIAEIERYLDALPERAAWARRMIAAGDALLVMEQVRHHPSSQAPQSAWARPLAIEIFDAIVRQVVPKRVLVRRGIGRPAEAPVGRDWPDDPQRERPWTPPSPYDAALLRVQAQVDLLAQRLEAILQPRRRLRQRSGYRSGRAVAMRQLIAFEADPRLVDRLWLRNSIPDRRDVAMTLLVDLSGSMEGAKAEAALLGTVLLAETLDRLGVPFAVHGFQDVLVPLRGFADAFDDAARRAIGEMPQEVSGCRFGGNNTPRYNDDGPCLLDAANELLAQSAQDRVLIVLSDGRPEGSRSTADDLSAAVAQLSRPEVGLDLIGLGLGAHTEHVRDFYPRSIANVPVARLATEIAAIIERALLRGR